MRKNGYFERRRRQQNSYWMYETIDQRLRSSFYQDPQIKEMLVQAEADIEMGRQTSFMAAQRLLDHFFSQIKAKE